MNAVVTGLSEAVRTMGQSVSKPSPEDMRVGKPEPDVLGKDLRLRLLCLLTMLTQKGARKIVRKAGNNSFEAYRQLCLVYGTSDHEGSTGLLVQIITYKFGSRIKDVEECQNECLELV